MFYTMAKQELSINKIRDLITKKKTYNERLRILDKYYKGENPTILSRDTCNRDEKANNIEKPNNKLVHPYAYTITSMIVGYLAGEPVRYVLPDDVNQVIFDKIMEYNDEPSVNNSIAIDQSKFGFGVEQLYLDEDANIRFNNISCYDTIFLLDNNIDKDIWAVIKFYYTEDNEFFSKDITEEEWYNINVEVYFEDKIQLYSNNFTLVEERINPFKDVPFIYYQNNDEFMGDYERVLHLIDAYDKVESDRANDIEYNTDAFLAISGVTMTDEDAAKMKRLRIFAIPDKDGKIEYVTKNVNNEPLQKYVEQINADIHKFSLTPDLNSEAFLSSNASGTALKLKFQGMEFLCGVKEGYWRKGLKRRIELINNILNLKSSAEDIDLVSDTKIVFTRNTVDNISELVNEVNQLSGIISREGQIEMLGSLIDVQTELDRLEVNQDLFSNNNLDNDDNNDNNLDKDNENTEGS